MIDVDQWLQFNRISRDPVFLLMPAFLSVFPVRVGMSVGPEMCEGLRLVNRLRNTNPAKFRSYVMMHLSFLLDLPDAQLEQFLSEKSSGTPTLVEDLKAKKHFFSKRKNSKGRTTVFSFVCLNILRPRQNGQHFAPSSFSDAILEIFLFRFEFHWALFLRVQLTKNIEIMVWCRIGELPLPEPVITQFTDICVTRPQCVYSQIRFEVFL